MKLLSQSKYFTQLLIISSLLICTFLVPLLMVEAIGGLPGSDASTGGSGGPVGTVSPGGDGGSSGVSNTGSCDLSTATFKTLLDCVRSSIVTPIINLLLALAVLVFFWGLVKYLYKGDIDSERTKGKNLMFFGIVGLFVMISIWGLVGLLTGIFFGDSDPAGVNPPIPQIPTGIIN